MGAEGLFATEAEAEQEAVRMGKNWIDRQPSYLTGRQVKDR
jgi:hypothetical protein